MVLLNLKMESKLKSSLVLLAKCPSSFVQEPPNFWFTKQNVSQSRFVITMLSRVLALLQPERPKKSTKYIVVVGAPQTGKNTFLKQVCSEMKGHKVQTTSKVYYNFFNTLNEPISAITINSTNLSNEQVQVRQTIITLIYRL